MKTISTDEDKPIPVGNMVDSLEESLENISALISQFRNLHPNYKKSSLFDLLQASPGMFADNLHNILQSINSYIIPDSPEEIDFYTLAGKCSVSFLEISRTGTILFANRNVESLVGNSEKSLKDQTFFSYLKPEYKSVLRHHLSVDNNHSHLIFQINSSTAGILSIEAQIESYRKGSDRVFGLLLRNITTKGDLNTRLKRIENNYDTLSETVNEVILRIDENLNIIYSNSAVRNTFGYEADEIFGKHLSILFPPEILKRYEKKLQIFFYPDRKKREKPGMNNSIEILGIHKNRGVSPMEISFGNPKDMKERILTCIIRDISQRKNAERKLHKLAYFDKLTNLGNRDLFQKDMEEHFQRQKKNFELGSLMFLDLDGFKNINDTLGHDAGDLLLVETAKRLHDCLRESDSVYRLGGDEFLVLLRKIRERKDASKVARNILNTIRMPFYLKSENISSHMVNIGVSVGIVLISPGDNNLNEMTKKADLAMYASKNAGKNRFTFYTEEMVQKINERWELEQGLKKALANNELEIHYQPIVNCEGRVKGFEALLRWYHPVLGYIPPGKFIPIAEETNMIIPIGAWVVENSCNSLAEWNAVSDNLYVTVNISTKQFEEPDIVQSIQSVIKRTGCNPANLKLELTETGIMQAPEQTIKKMNNLKKALPLLQIVIDDFGTGYSSLNYLANLPTDILKIDLSFVSKLHDSNNRKIINSIINLADALEMQYVAEGIQTQEEWEYFRNLKCDRMQGYYFSKAVPKKDVITLLKAERLPLSQY